MSFPSRRRRLIGGSVVLLSLASPSPAFLAGPLRRDAPHTSPLFASRKKKPAKKRSPQSSSSSSKNPALGFGRASGKWDGCEPLRKWLLDSGATVAPVNVGVVDPASGLRGVTASAPLARGDVILSIPRSACIIDEGRVDAGPLAASLFARGNDGALPACSRNALYLLWAGREGTGEPDWAPLTAALPSPEDFVAEGGPMELWEEGEVAECECGHLIAEVSARSGDLRRQYDEAVLPRWDAKELGPPPGFDEFQHAVCVVTSRNYGEGEADAGTSSMVVPGVDMCNHGDPPVNTRHGLAPWGDFVVYADAAIPAGEEILITYGRLPNRLLLAQFGFLLPGLPERALASDAALVRVDGLFDAEEGAKPATAASEAEAERRWEEGPGPTALGNMARNAIVRRKEDGRVARWQPATLARKAAEHLGGDAEKQFGGLLERELGAYSTTLEEDEKELARGGASARKRLALQFRIQSKRLLQRELDMLEPGIGSRA